MKYVKTDGGRSKAPEEYQDGGDGDCGVRALAIAADIPYEEAYELLREEQCTCPTNGTERKVMRVVAKELGFQWVPLMKAGTGCTVHVKKDELPQGRLILSLSKHFSAMVDGVIHDLYDPSRGGTRCVYG